MGTSAAQGRGVRFWNKGSCRCKWATQKRIKNKASPTSPAQLLALLMSTQSQRRFVIKEETIDETGECAFFVEYVASGDRVRVDIKDLADPFYLNSLGEIDW